MADGDGAATTTTDTGNGDGADKTFAQADVDQIVKDRLARERSKFADYDDLKQKATRLDELQNANKSDLERLTGERDSLHGQVSTLTSEKDSLSSENLRLRVALEKEIPAELIDRLRGDSREDLEKDADQLLELVKPGASFDGGARGQVGGSDMNTLLRQAAGRA